MARRKEREEEQEIDIGKIRKPDPSKEEMFAIVDQKLGGPHVRVICEDGKERLGRIPGKFKRRMWIVVGDVVICKLWEYRKDRCDIVHKYRKTEVEKLKQEGYLKNLEDYLGLVG